MLVTAATALICCFCAECGGCKEAVCWQKPLFAYWHSQGDVSPRCQMTLKAMLEIVLAVSIMTTVLTGPKQGRHPANLQQL